MSINFRYGQLNRYYLATHPDNLVRNTDLSTVNTARIECTDQVLRGVNGRPGGFVNALVYASGINTNSGEIIVFDDYSQTALPINNIATSTKPDIILADDVLNPGIDYIAVICYEDINGDIILENYSITNVNTGSLMLNIIGSVNLGEGNYPKIDVVAKPQIIGETRYLGSLHYKLPTLDSLIVVWNSGIPNSNGDRQDVSYYFSDVRNLIVCDSGTLPAFGLHPDVAVVTDMSTNRSHAFIVAWIPFDPTFRHHLVVNQLTLGNSPSLTYIYAYPPGIRQSASPNILSPHPYNNDYPYPRIEGKGLISDLHTEPAAWMVVTLSDNWDMQYFWGNGVTIMDDTIIAEPFGSVITRPSASSFCANITMGIGHDWYAFYGGGIHPLNPFGNNQYTLAWGGSQFSDLPIFPIGVYYYSVGVHPLTPKNNVFYTPLGPPSYYKINNFDPALSGTSYMDEYMLGISTSANSGNGIFTAWSNSYDKIFVKSNDLNYEFKPQKIDTIPIMKDNISIFPNPANDFIHLKYHDLKIKELSLVNNLGQIVYTGKKPDSFGKIITSSFMPGLYYLVIKTEDDKEIKKSISIIR